MALEYVAASNAADAHTVLGFLKNESTLQLVSYGDHAVDLQLLDAPSPHAVHVSASYEGAELRLTLHMAVPDAERWQATITAQAAARGVTLRFVRRRPGA